MKGRKILKRSGVFPTGHMDGSGVVSACLKDMRSQTFTWMGFSGILCVLVCPCMRTRHSCVHVGGVCPCVRGPWHLLMKKSSQRALPRPQAALQPQEPLSPVCHIGCWSSHNAHSLIRNVSVCLSVSGEVTHTN